MGSSSSRHKNNILRPPPPSLIVKKRGKKSKNEKQKIPKEIRNDVWIKYHGDNISRPHPPSLIVKKRGKKSKNEKQKIPKEIRNDVWIKYHGDNTKGICYCCGTSIQRYNAGWHCSHVIASSKGGSIRVENLRTCCKHCNLSMGDQNLYVYIRDKNLKGPGYKNVYQYLQKHHSQINDRRTNNWGK